MDTFPDLIVFQLFHYLGCYESRLAMTNKRLYDVYIRKRDSHPQIKSRFERIDACRKEVIRTMSPRVLFDRLYYMKTPNDSWVIFARTIFPRGHIHLYTESKRLSVSLEHNNPNNQEDTYLLPEHDDILSIQYNEMMAVQYWIFPDTIEVAWMLIINEPGQIMTDRSIFSIQCSFDDKLIRDNNNGLGYQCCLIYYPEIDLTDKYVFSGDMLHCDALCFELYSLDVWIHNS